VVIGISVNHQPLSLGVMPKRSLPILISTWFAFGAQRRNEIMSLDPLELKSDGKTLQQNGDPDIAGKIKEGSDTLVCEQAICQEPATFRTLICIDYFVEKISV
jgi:hypothetical protein